MSFAESTALVGLALLLASALGFAGAGALFGRARPVAERAGWGVFLGVGAIGAAEGLSLLLRISASRGAVVLLAVTLLGIAWFFRLGSATIEPFQRGRPGAAGVLLGIALAAGVLLYLLRAMTEPMWANDFLAIWGLKGKVLFEARGLPAWPFRSGDAGFSHPEYPIGLPLVYAGFSALLGRWDDHAMALLFPAFQAATLAALLGWLRRRGVERPVALGAAAIVALFDPLYSGFLTGMAEVPLSGALLLLATSWSDALDGTDTGPVRRVAVASVLAASLKNEGFFFAILAGIVGAVGLSGHPPRRRRVVVAAACALPALAAFGIHRVVLGAATLRDFDPGLLRPERLPELAPRILVALRVACDASIRPAWPGLVCVAVILVVGRRCPAGDRILALSALTLVVYLLLPALAVRGPEWLVRTTLARTASALVPVVAAGLAARISSRSGESGEAAADRRASEARAATPTLSTPAS